jgi:hypothetical protein
MPRLKKRKTAPRPVVNTLSLPKKQRLSQEEKRRVQNASSPIERLPLELLVQIFIESMEISLPQASHYIGKALSSSWVITKFMNRLPLVEAVQLNQFMSCRFFSYEWFRDNRQEFEATIIRSKCYHTEEIRRGYRIPPKLLRWPNTHTKLSFVNQWHSQHTLLFDASDPSSFSNMLEALQEAIADDSTEMVNCLLRFFPAAVSSDSKRMGRAGTCCPLPNGFPIPQYILLDAVIKYGCHPDIVGMLLIHGMHFALSHGERPPGEAVSPFDHQLWEWAERNDKQGQWLLSMLRFVNHCLYALDEESLDGYKSCHHAIVDAWSDMSGRVPSILGEIGRLGRRVLLPYTLFHSKWMLDELVWHWEHCAIHRPVTLPALDPGYESGDAV